MEKNLFDKYSKQIIKRNESKEEVIEIIKKETGINLNIEDFSLANKIIFFQVSSVKKAMLTKLKIEEILKKYGYYIKQ